MTSARDRLLRAAPWLAILVVIAVVQVLRAAPLDAAVFAVVALALAVDVLHVLPEPRALRVPLPPLLAAALVAVAVIAVAPRHGVVTGVVVVAVGATALALAWPDPPAREHGRDADGVQRRRLVRGAILWAVVVVALCLWELSSFLLGRATAATKLTHPAVSDLLDPLLDSGWGRAVFGALWLLGGIVLIRAGRRR